MMDIPQTTLEVLATLHASLERSDSETRQRRADRILWSSKYETPVRSGLASEPVRMLDEARACFVHGHYIATLVTAMSVIEHVIVEELNDRAVAGYKASLYDVIRTAIKANVFEEELLQRADSLRVIRNPFVHSKGDDNEHGMRIRSQKKGDHSDKVLEDDACEALDVMYGLFYSALRRPVDAVTPSSSRPKARQQ